MPSHRRDRGKQLWLQLPPMSGSAPRRLLVFLHGAGSTPEVFAPVALAWQLKFPGATAAIVEAPRPSSACAGKDWYDPSGHTDSHGERIAEAADEVARRVDALQVETGLGSADTVLVGYSQGATVALELARRAPGACAIVVSYAGRLARPVREGETIAPTIHLIHGELDSVVPVAHSERAFRHLQAGGADVSLDIALDETHSLGQALVNLGTTRVLQTVFRGRRPKRFPPSSHRSETLQ
jgi:phospholipase/carboxylesterase